MFLPCSVAEVSGYQMFRVAAGVATVVLYLGLCAFTLLAFFKAFTRKTVGWIIGACISMMVLLTPGGLLVVAAVCGGLLPERKPAWLGVASAQPPPRFSNPTPPVSLSKNVSLFPSSTFPLTPPANPDEVSIPDTQTAHTVKGTYLAYQLTLPPDWMVSRSGNTFDLIASHRSVWVGVLAEEVSAGTPDAMVKIMQKRLQNAARDVHFGVSSSVTIDGRAWLQYSATCQSNDYPLAYQYFAYAGPEGSFQVVGWTTQNLYDREVGQMRAVASTFRFPSPAPSPPAAAPPEPVPTARPLSSPTPSASPVKRKTDPKYHGPAAIG